VHFARRVNDESAVVTAMVSVGVRIVPPPEKQK
jgi:hypothetical protein